jgi:mannosylfructose-6-phosphate phosphatase
MERVKLLISDVDGTLLGDVAALAEFCQWRRGPGRRVRLVYNSGRFVDSVRASIRDHGMPEPDAVIGGVGTQIVETASGRPWAAWPPRDGRWDPETIHRVCRGFPELAPQPAKFISEFKISYFGFELEPERLERLSARLAHAGQCARIVYSSQRDLDILPAGVDKGAAALRLCQAWAIDPTCAAVAGDSGNDLAMFRPEFRGIVVGNALPELRTLAGPNVYQAAASFAAGVLEGLHHWMAPSAPSLEPVA